MDNKKIGSFIKDLMKSKGMNQEDLSQALGISPQAVSKALNGVNTFDVGNLQVISDLFKVTIDDILRGNLQTSTSFMTDQERIVRLGLNAFKSAENKLVVKFDENDKTTLNYAFEQENAQIVEYIIERGYFRNNYGHYARFDKLLELLIDNKLYSQLAIILDHGTPEKTSKKLWSSNDETIIDKLYYKANGNSKALRNFDLAIKHNNKKVIDDYLSTYFDETKKRKVSDIPHLELAIDFNNEYYIKQAFKKVKKNPSLGGLKVGFNALKAFNISETLFTYLVKECEDNEYVLVLQNIGELLEILFDNKEYSKMIKYSKYGAIPSGKLDNVDFDKIAIEDLLFLFAGGALPSVRYNDEISVKNYVDVVNKIILKLTKEIIELKK